MSRPRGRRRHVEGAGGGRPRGGARRSRHGGAWAQQHRRPRPGRAAPVDHRADARQCRVGGVRRARGLLVRRTPRRAGFAVGRSCRARSLADARVALAPARPVPQGNALARLLLGVARSRSRRRRGFGRRHHRSPPHRWRVARTGRRMPTSSTRRREATLGPRARPSRPGRRRRSPSRTSSTTSPTSSRPRCAPACPTMRCVRSSTTRSRPTSGSALRGRR